MSDQNSLAVLGKQHQIPFPMTRLSPLVDVGRSLLDRDTPLNVIDRTSPFVPPPAALAFSPRQVVPPTKIIGASNLSVDESIDRLIADPRTPLFLFQSTADLGRRPTLSQPLEDLSLKSPIAQQSTAPPATALRLLLGVGRLLAHLCAAVTFKLTHYSRWRAIHSCRDLADCFPAMAKSGKRAALFQRKLFILLSHCNTLSKKCCTWSVNLGGLCRWDGAPWRDRQPQRPGL